MSHKAKSPLLRFLAFAKPYRWTIALVIVAGVAKFTLPLVPAWITQIIVDDVIRNERGVESAIQVNILWRCAAVLAVIAVLEVVAVYYRGLASVKLASSVAYDLRRGLWKHLQRLSLSFHQSRPTGKLVSRLMSDVAVSQQMLGGGIINVAIDAVSATAAMVTLLVISWELTLVVLCVLPIYAVLYHKINPRIRQASHDVQEQTSIISGSAVERLNGVAVVQSFAQERAEQHRFKVEVAELRGRHYRRGKLNQIMLASSEFLTAISVGIVWILGAYFAIQGHISTGQVIRFLATMALLLLPIRRFSDINVVYQNSMAAIERVFSIFDIAPDVQERAGAVSDAPVSGRIEFDRVQFHYNDRPPVLLDLSFTIEAGERVAIVGESGAGKSTLVMLISRLYDVRGGSIKVDGVDVRDYKLRPLRRSIGIVLQDTILFSGTVRENLQYGKKDAAGEEIVDAAKAANAHRFIMELPDGYETIIGERGLTLSGGQRQRISLARTILQDPRILILDEATSSLDSESENLITEALERVMAGRTCVIIAHRLSTVTSADRILVFKEGRLIEQGPHAELLASRGPYRELFEQQFGPLKRLIDESKQAD